MQTSGKCDTPITEVSKCSAAAVSLGITGYGGNALSPTSSVDDSYYPHGCIFSVYTDSSLALGFYAMGIEMSHPRAAEIIKWYDDHVDGRMDVHEYANLIANLQEGITRVGPSKSGSAAAASERSAVILLREIIARDGGQAELDKALAELKRGSAGLSAEQVAKASLHQPAAAQEADSASSSPTTEPSNSMDRIKEQIKSLFPDPGAGSVARTSPAKGSGGDAVAASVEPRDCAPNPDHLSA